MTQTVQIQDYTLCIGRGLLPTAGAELRTKTTAQRVALVADNNVDELYGETVAAALQKEGLAVCRYRFAAGEHSKNMVELTRLLEFLAAHRLDRNDCIVALGGGVCGDLAGLAAAVYLRGISCLQLPTTLLAAVDSSIGGKTAVNLDNGKNLVGAFHHPLLALCDCNTFATLPAAEIANGMAETVKAALIGDGELLTLLSPACWTKHIEEIVTRAASVKAALVTQDEFDRGARHLLNFGHTLGHALEARSGYRICHGQAVATGMAETARAAQRAGLCATDYTTRLERVLAAFGLPTVSPYPFIELLPYIATDKKRGGTEYELIIPHDIGQLQRQNFSRNGLLEFFTRGTSV